MANDHLLQIFLSAFKRIDKAYVSYLMANTKVERELFAQIGYHADQLLQKYNPQLYAAVEYKRIDFVIVEKHPTGEDKLLCIIEGKCYYTWDTAERHWNGKWFDPTRIDSDRPPKNYRECKNTLNKLRQFDEDPRSPSAKKYFVLFLEHFGNRVRNNFPYAGVHNKVLSDYKDDPESLIPKSKIFIDALFSKLGLLLVFYEVQKEFAVYWGTPMGLITAIGELV